MNKLMIAQVDHAGGEIIGHSMNRLYELGCKNVQLLQSATKKNRPGYVFLLDLPDTCVEAVALYMGTELGIWGYHLLESTHIHFDVDYRSVQLSITAAGRYHRYLLRPKYISHDGRLINIKFDYKQVAELQQLLAADGCFCTLERLRALLDTEMRKDVQAQVLELKFK
ncbi:MAG: DUF111 family protein [Oscillospiraceae bacterium]|jgi:uncharacterized protein (DUF111 family)|nr:DUF111 family protein [Oscillospiraceae bacterium]MBQ8929167.1 DUF111 family protein [Oscillospiraceae bacterium]MBR6431059.1 DUF111 family protein [Oscillospiraceae bacterium]